MTIAKTFYLRWFASIHSSKIIHWVTLMTNMTKFLPRRRYYFSIEGLVLEVVKKIPPRVGGKAVSEAKALKKQKINCLINSSYKYGLLLGKTTCKKTIYDCKCTILNISFSIFVLINIIFLPSTALVNVDNVGMLQAFTTAK